MNQWILYFVCMFIMQVSECERVEVSSHCVADKFCLKLYRLESPVNWQQASTNCKNGGMQPLTVQDHNTQQAVMKLLRNFEVTEPIWLAGQMAADRSAWISVNAGETFSAPSIITNNSTVSANCLTGGFRQNGSSYYNAVNCSETLTDNKLICQVRSSSACSFGGMYLDGYCYILVNETSRDWYRAQSLCHQRYGMDLYYKLPLLYGDMGSLLPWMSKDDMVWVGALRRQWRWAAKLEDSYVWYNMRYFNWKTGAGWKVPTESTILCTVLHGGTGLWEDITCSSQQQYIICQDEYQEQGTLSPTVRQTYTAQPTTDPEENLEITTVTIEQMTSDQSKASPEKKAFTPAYIAAIVTGAVIIIVVVLMVILIRKRNLKNNHHTYVNSTRTSNDYMSTETTFPSSTSDVDLLPQDSYAIFSGLGEQHPRNHSSMADEPSNDSTVVYSLAGGIDMEHTAAISHIVTGQGDEYALPSRVQHSGKDRHLTGAEDDNGDLMVDNQHYGSIN